MKQPQQVVFTCLRLRRARAEERKDDQRSPSKPSANVPVQPLPPFPYVFSITAPKVPRQPIRTPRRVDCPVRLSLYCAGPSDHRGMTEVEWRR
jgi:hypothetical protein